MTTRAESNKEGEMGDGTTAGDDPQLDATDFAHPAWWRGYDYGAESTMCEVVKVLDGEPISGTCSQPWEGIREAEARGARRARESFRRRLKREIERLSPPNIDACLSG